MSLTLSFYFTKCSSIDDIEEPLSKTIKEIEETIDGDEHVKRIYLNLWFKISNNSLLIRLESMTTHKYLYDADEDNSEHDYINKL